MRSVPMCFLLLCTVVPAQDKATDPGGWTKAKWGMTESEVKQAFPDAKTIPAYGMSYLGIPHYRIGNIGYTVTFGFSKKDNRLIGVALKAEDPPDMPGVYSEQAKDALLAALRDKYGEPTSRQDEQNTLGITRSWKWLLSQTSMELAFCEARERKYRFTILQYSKRESSDQL